MYRALLDFGSLTRGRNTFILFSSTISLANAAGVTPFEILCTYIVLRPPRRCVAGPPPLGRRRLWPMPGFPCAIPWTPVRGMLQSCPRWADASLPPHPFCC
jgi:hypothetical protein